MTTALRHGWVITLRELKHWQREPWAPIVGISFSIMLLLMFGFLLGGAIELPGGGDYLPYLLPGIFTLSMLFGVEATVGAITNDTKKGITDRFRSLPMSGVAVPFGRSAADVLKSAVELAVLMVGGLLIGWRVNGSLGAALVAAGLLLWLRFAMLWLGIFLALTFRSEATLMAVQILVWPIGFLSGVFVSPETMPGPLRFLAEWNPASATAAACRALFGNPTGITSGPLADYPLLLAVLWPAVLLAIFIPLSARAYRQLSR